MDNSKILIKTSQSHLTGLIAWLLLILTIFCILMGVHYFVAIPLAIITLFLLFDKQLSIIVYEDKFTFSYANSFGPLMKKNLTYLYKDVVNYKCEIESFQMNEAEKMAINSAEILEALLLPSTFPAGNSTDKNPKATLTIEYKDPLGRFFTKEFSFDIKDNSFALALDKIERKLTPNSKQA